MEAEATIRVVRSRAPWRDRLGSYTINVDGHDVAKVRDGRTVDVSVSAGAHQVRAHVGRQTSGVIMLTTQPGSIAECAVRPNGNSWTAVTDILGARNYIDLRPSVRTDELPGVEGAVSAMSALSVRVR